MKVQGLSQMPDHSITLQKLKNPISTENMLESKFKYPHVKTIIPKESDLRSECFGYCNVFCVQQGGSYWKTRFPNPLVSTSVYNLSLPQPGMFAIKRAKLPSWCFVLGSPAPQKDSVHMLSLSPNRTGWDLSRAVQREQQACEFRGERGWFLSPELAVADYFLSD